MNGIKISIIVPVYNSANFLERCITSLVNQTIQDTEIILINDGSTDNSLEICKKFAKIDSRITVLSQENQGQSKARNAGIDIAKGDYIGFVDSDDWIDLDFYEKLYNAALENDADIAAAGIIRLNKKSKNFHLRFEKTEATNNADRKFELCDVPDKSYVINKIYKLKKLNKLNIRFEDGVIYEDVIFTPQVLYYTDELVTVPGTYYYYWRHANSTVKLRNKKANNDSVYAHKKAAEFIKENNIDTSNHTTITKRYKLLGFSIFKIVTRGNKKSYRLFNIIRWQV